MDRVLFVEQDRGRQRSLALAGLERGIGVGIAESLGDALAYLAQMPAVTLVVADAAVLHAWGIEDRRRLVAAAAAVPVVALLETGIPLEERVALETLGFAVVARPTPLADLLAKFAATSRRERRVRGPIGAWRRGGG